MPSIRTIKYQTSLPLALALCLLMAPAAALPFEGTIQLLSHTPENTSGNGESGRPAIGWDGDEVVFASHAYNLVPGDDNESGDIFLWERSTGELRPVTATQDPGGWNFIESGGADANISLLGDYVLFNSRSPDLPGAVSRPSCSGWCWNTFLWDRKKDVFELVSAADHSSGAGNGSRGHANASRASISANGRFVVFLNTGSNLDPDTPGEEGAWRIFLRDRLESRTFDLTIPVEGDNPDGPSMNPVISADGQWVAYRSKAENIQLRDQDGLEDIFLWWVDPDSGHPLPVLRIDSEGGTTADGETSIGISAFGRDIVFTTPAQLAPQDTDQDYDAYVWRLWEGIELVSGAREGRVRRPSIDLRGNSTAYEIEGSPHLYLYQHGVTTDLVWRPDGSPPTGSALQSMVSGDGKNIAFGSRDAGLVTGDVNGQLRDIFLLPDTFEIVDPQRKLEGEGGVLKAEPEDWMDDSLPSVTGVAADGVTPVILRFDATFWGNLEEVTFRIFDDNGNTSPEEAGTLSSRVGVASGNPEQEAAITVETDPLNGRIMAFALYEPPVDFVRGDATCPEPPQAPNDACRKDRPIRLEIEHLVCAGCTGTTTHTRFFDLERPPLVLLHGLWSGPRIWKDSSLRSDVRFDVSTPSYEETSARWFSTNFMVPYHAWREATERRKELHSAVTQVDIVAHSQGGVLTRIHQAIDASSPWDAGYFHKVITLNSPHRGSPGAACLVLARGTPAGQYFIREYETGVFANPWKLSPPYYPRPTQQGAVDDLDPLSTPILELPGTTGPAAAIVSLGGRDFAAASDCESSPLSPGQLLDCTSLRWYDLLERGIDELFLNVEHDLVVHEASQRAGLAGDFVWPFYFLSLEEPAIHSSFSEGDEDRVSEKIAELLNLPIDPPGFPPNFAAGFPARDPADVRPEEAVVAERCPWDIPLSPNTFAITGPPSAQPGDTITLAAAGLGLERVLFIGPGGIRITTGPSFEVSWTLPSDLIGEILVTASGVTISGQLMAGEELVIPITLSAELEDLWIEPSLIRLGSRWPEGSFSVVGLFSDGVERNLTSSELGTKYSVEPPETTVSVPRDGVVRSENVGTAILRAENSGFIGAAEVQVLEPRLVLEEPVPGLWGQENTQTVRGATPGETVHLVRSDELGFPERWIPYFPCDFPQGDIPPEWVSTTQADEDGVATFVYTPEVAQGGTMYIQAAEARTVIGILPTACSFSEVMEFVWEN